ncbi:MAG: glycosyltransferase family 39 protein [Thermoanaerobaculia bacterium]
MALDPKTLMRAAIGPWLGRSAALAWTAVVVSWLLDAVFDPPKLLCQAVVAFAGIVLAAWLGREAYRLWRGEDPWGRWLLGLLATSIAVHFIGLHFEVGQRYFGDEGIYRAAAAKINDGELLRPWFIYPHLLFYLDALALWIAALFDPLVASLAKLLYGVEGPHTLATLATRCVTSGLAALTVLPVMVIARRVAGTPAVGAVAGLFAVLSPIFIHVAHLNISDVSSAFFATLTLMQVSRLLDRESTRDYLLAGLWAGLTAGSKYPAGVVAVAIVAIYLRWWVKNRRPGWGLIWAGLAAMAAFVATTPSFLAFPDKVFVGSGPDIMFGYRQYASGGWPGVVRGSNVVFYGEQLRHNFGAPLLALGVLGLAALRRSQWARLLWVLPFPVLYVVLILRMNIAVPRNLLPALPALAMVLGLGAWGWLRWTQRLAPVPRRTASAAVAVLCLALPLQRTVAEVVKLARPTTRVEAADWVKENLPPGSFFLAENYTPNLGSRWQYPVSRPRFVIRYTREQVRDPRHDFLFVASDSYQRFLEPENLDRTEYEVAAERYREIFDTFELVREFAPQGLQAGPVLRLYKVDPEPLVYADRRSFTAAEALIPNPTMRPDGDDGPILHHAPIQWSLFKTYLEAGRYRVTIAADMTEPTGTLRITNRDRDAVATAVWDDGLQATVTLPERDKYFFYVHLAAGSRLRGLEIEPEQVLAGD